MSLILLGCIFLIGTMNYKLKRCVFLQEEEYTTVRQEIILINESIHLLKAELSSLIRPEHLYEMAQTHLNLFQIKGSQLIYLKLPGISSKKKTENNLIRMDSLVS